MTKCNILLVEDYREDRQMLAEGLRSEYGHNVKEFPDLQTLRQADEDGTLPEGFEEGLPIIVLLDIMLAQELDEDALYAPRRQEDSSADAGSGNRFVDDELGVDIGAEIRQGGFNHIDNHTPILFFTARRKERIEELIEERFPEVGHTLCIEKPAFLDEVQPRIIRLLAMSGSDTGEEGPR